MIVGGVWEIPWGKQLTGAAGAVLGGWQGGWLLTFESGQPFTVSQSGDTQNKGGNEASRPHTLGVNANLPERASVIPRAGSTPPPSCGRPTRARRLPTACSSPDRAVMAPRAATLLLGPGANAWDLSVSKNFKMPWKEGHTLMFRTEFFNAFNTPQFNNPGNTLGTGCVRCHFGHARAEPEPADAVRLEVFILSRLPEDIEMREPPPFQHHL